MFPRVVYDYWLSAQVEIEFGARNLIKTRQSGMATDVSNKSEVC